MARALLLLVLAALFALASASDSSNVVVLTPENFDTVVDGSKPVFVEFYAPWCGHCKNLVPAYEAFANAFANAKDKVVIAKVDADAHRDLGSRFEVKGFPTLRWFPNGPDSSEKYEGGRTEDDLISFVETKTGLRAKRAPRPPSYVKALTGRDFADVVTKDETTDALVEFYAPWCGHCKHLAPEYEKVGAVYRNEPGVVIAKVDCDANSELCQEYGVSGYPTLKWFSKSDKATPSDYDGGRDVDAFVDFINKRTGIQRDSKGRLSSQTGRVSALDELVKGYVDSDDKDAVVAKAKEVAADLTGDEAKSAKVYLRTMEQLKDKPDYVANEKERLNRMLESTSLNAGKVDEFTVRLNILAAFE